MYDTILLQINEKMMTPHQQNGAKIEYIVQKNKNAYD